MSNITITWSKHPSTNTCHAFIADSDQSACKREFQSERGRRSDQPGVFVCTRCLKALVNTGEKLPDYLDVPIQKMLEMDAHRKG